MLRLKSRQSFIPNGFVFYLPEVKWKAPRMASFDTIVSGLLGVIQANRALAEKNKWPTDREGVADWVDLYNATVCAKMGWDDYILTGGAGGSLPKASAPLQSVKGLAAAAAASKKLVAGAKTLIGWLDSGEPPVDRDEATRRAAICVACPHNNKSELTDWFTVPASELIRRQVQKLAERSISTIHDESLRVCDVCLCPLKLKVHTPLARIMKEMRPETLAELEAVPGCWVRRESPVKNCGCQRHD